MSAQLRAGVPLKLGNAQLIWGNANLVDQNATVPGAESVRRNLVIAQYNKTDQQMEITYNGEVQLSFTSEGVICTNMTFETINTLNVIEAPMYQLSDTFTGIRPKIANQVTYNFGDGDQVHRGIVLDSGSKDIADEDPIEDDFRRLYLPYDNDFGNYILLPVPADNTVPVLNLFRKATESASAEYKLIQTAFTDDLLGGGEEITYRSGGLAVHKGKVELFNAYTSTSNVTVVATWNNTSTTAIDYIKANTVYQFTYSDGGGSRFTDIGFLTDQTVEVNSNDFLKPVTSILLTRAIPILWNAIQYLEIKKADVVP